MLHEQHREEAERGLSPEEQPAGQPVDAAPEAPAERQAPLVTPVQAAGQADASSNGAHAAAEGIAAARPQPRLDALIPGTAPRPGDSPFQRSQAQAEPRDPAPAALSPYERNSPLRPSTPPAQPPSYSRPPVSSYTYSTATAPPPTQPTAPSTAPSPLRTPPPPPQKQPDAPRGLLDMADGEEVVQEVDSGDDGRFILTDRRLIYHGKTFENALFSSAALADVTAVELSRRPRDMRSAWWGIAGAIAAVLVWQVTSNETVGVVAGAAVGAIAALLLADFWFRPPGMVLRFSTPGGKVEGPVSGKKMREAEQLAARMLQLRDGTATGGRRGRGSGGQMPPPGGSPGLW